MKRIITALVLIPLVSYVALWGPQWLCLAVVAAVALLCYHEYAGIVAAHGIERPGPIGYAAGLLVLLVEQQQMLLVTLLALLALAFAVHGKDLAKALPRAAALVLGVLYIFGAWRCAIALRIVSPYWLFFVLAVNWVGDSVAYYVGGAIGRHKLAPKLSPAKSWEGTIASVLTSVVFGVFYLGWLLPSVSLVERIVFSAAGNVAGQFGDLSESALKRGAGVKDSGTLLPGHGGWLDRVDSTLFALPVVYLLLSFPW
jgi:phosphatidate cytidylyltransferase